jgi:hypothetical protein
LKEDGSKNKTHLGKISFLKFADNYASLRYGQDRYPKTLLVIHGSGLEPGAVVRGLKGAGK